MKKLTVLFYRDQARQRRILNWMREQPSYVELEYLAFDSAEARERFPSLCAPDAPAPEQPPQITRFAGRRSPIVVTDEGAIYRNDKAWLMCMWALFDYRKWALEFGKPDKAGHAEGFLSSRAFVRTSVCGE